MMYHLQNSQQNQQLLLQHYHHQGSTKMISLTGIRFLIEFSSILVLAFLCFMHEFTDVTWAKQFNLDHDSNGQYRVSILDDFEQTSIIAPSSASSNNFHPSENNDEIDDENSNLKSTSVRFSPESLDFGHHSIGMPTTKTVFVVNEDKKSNLQLISISGNTEHYHCSFFEFKTLRPGTNTSFRVVFLARQDGLIKNTLYIHTSAGSFDYQVSAYGEVSPFRIRPLIGARVPLNSSFASLIYVYNPFSTPLQLTEMYTSGGGLHLELPNDQFEAVSSVWKVPPYETKPVMKAHFVARTASNHTSYIRIKTDQPDVQLMLPVEIEVIDCPGLYSPIDTLDFGVLRAKHDPPKMLPIHVINAAQKSVLVQNIVVTPLSDGLSIVNFNGPIKLPPQLSNPLQLGNLLLDPSKLECHDLCSGKVLIKSKNNQYKLTIPFIVRIIKGELLYNKSHTHFFVNASSKNQVKEKRLISFENHFDDPINVQEIIIPEEAKAYFRLNSRHPYSLPLMLSPKKSVPVLSIEFDSSNLDSHFSTVFRLKTNLSYFDIPVHAYRGRLDLFMPNSSDQTKLDMGLLGVNEQKTTIFLIANYNPIPVRLIHWHCNITDVTIELVGTSHGGVDSIYRKFELSRSELRFLKPNHFAIFKVHVSHLSEEGRHNGSIAILTTYEKLIVPLTLNILKGDLSLHPVVMPKTFPGKTVKSILNIKSNYSNSIEIKETFFTPKDERFRIKLSDNLIKPGDDNKIEIEFDTSVNCFQNLCYTALDIEKEVGHLWLLGSGMYSDTAYIDKELYKLLRNQWLKMSEAEKNPSATLVLKIDGFGTYTTSVQAHHHWPRLANKLVIRFSSIRIGQQVTKELLIENPSDRQVLVQAINIIDYPNSEILAQLISDSIFHQQWSKNNLQTIQMAIRNDAQLSVYHNQSVFSLFNNTISSNSQVRRMTEWLGVEPNVNSYIMLLPPGIRHRLTITFSPMEERNYTSLLILRNNLTIIDVVMLRGEGGRGLLKIGKSLPNASNSKLVIDIPEKTLEKKCRKSLMSNHQSSYNGGVGKSTKNFANPLVIRERFSAQNVGRMALQIRNFLIDGVPCEGHGFRILHCEPTLLNPNQTFNLEILYSPDFTQQAITHELTIIIDDNQQIAQKFLLVATIPSNLMSLCLEALPRPPWETHLYYILVMMAFFVLILSTVIAIFDGHRIAFNYYSTKYEFLNNFESKKDEESETKSNIKQEKSVMAQQNTVLSQSITKMGNGVTTNGPVVNVKNSNQANIGNNQQQKVRNRRFGSKQLTKKNQSLKSNPSVNQSESTKTLIVSADIETESKLNHNDDSSHSFSEKFRSSTSSSAITIKSNAWIESNLSSSSSSLESNRQSSPSNNRSAEKLSKNSDYRKVESLPSQTNKKLYDGSILSLESKKHKREGSSSKTNELNNNQTTKKQSTRFSNKILSNETINKSKSDDIAFSKEKSLPNQSLALASESLKSSLESLSSSISTSSSLAKDETILKDFTQKTRSSTIPSTNSFSFASKTLNNSNLSLAKNKNHSDIGIFESLERKNPPSNFDRCSTTDKFFNNLNAKGSKLEKIFPNPSLSLTNHHRDNDYFGHFDPNALGKDIWDSPITNFDTDMAMNELVKQTEDFACNSNDNKVSSGMNRLVNNRRYERQFNQNVRFNQLTANNNGIANDDKWEIGEWSNDFLNRISSNNVNDENVFHSFKNVDNYETTMKKNRFSTSNAINYQEYRNSLNDHNNSSRILKSAKKLKNNFKSGANNVENPKNDSVFEISSPIESFSPNSSFSPVIGRPSSIQMNSKQSTSSSSALKPKFDKFQNFGDNFNGLNSFSSLPLTSASSSLEFSNESEKNYLDNLDSFLDPISKSSNFNQAANAIDMNTWNNSLTLSDFKNFDPIAIQTIPQSLSSFSNKTINEDDAFNLGIKKDFAWQSPPVWPMNSQIRPRNDFSGFSTSALVNSTNTISKNLTSNNIMATRVSSNWPTLSAPIKSPLDNTLDHRQPTSNLLNSLFQSDSIKANNGQISTEEAWPSFDSFDFNRNFENSTKFPTSTAVNQTDLNPLALKPEATNSIASNFDSASTVFELFGGSSPWLPLSTSPDIRSNKINDTNSSASPIDIEDRTANCFNSTCPVSFAVAKNPLSENYSSNSTLTSTKTSDFVSKPIDDLDQSDCINEKKFGQ